MEDSTDYFLIVPYYIITHSSPHDLELRLVSSGRGVLPASKSGLKLKVVMVGSLELPDFRMRFLRRSF